MDTPAAAILISFTMTPAYAPARPACTEAFTQSGYALKEGEDPSARKRHA
jgi:hypothetical protein